MAPFVQFVRRRVSLVLSIAIAWTALLGALPVEGDLSGADEYRLKAAFLLHFAQMVDWPAASSAAEPSPLVICTLGGGVFRGDLDTIVRGRTAGSRPLTVSHLTAAQPIQGCHVLFVAAGERTRVPLLVARLKDAAVLLVGETDDFIENGGVIGFVVEGNKVRFDINLPAARRANLKVSSRLLLLARNVKGGRP